MPDKNYDASSKVIVIIIKNAPQIELVIDGKKRMVFAFLDTSLRELRTIADLSSQFEFYFEGLPVRLQ